MGSGLCPHELVSSQCSYCRTAGQPRVYISGGGQSYHFDRACEALRRGQAHVERRGGEVADIAPVSIAEAERQDYQACAACGTVAYQLPFPEARLPRPRPEEVWLCMTEWSRPTLRRAGRYHYRRNCPALKARADELSETCQRSVGRAR